MGGQRGNSHGEDRVQLSLGWREGESAENPVKQDPPETSPDLGKNSGDIAGLDLLFSSKVSAKSEAEDRVKEIFDELGLHFEEGEKVEPGFNPYEATPEGETKVRALELEAEEEEEVRARVARIASPDKEGKESKYLEEIIEDASEKVEKLGQKAEKLGQKATEGIVDEINKSGAGAVKKVDKGQARSIVSEINNSGSSVSARAVAGRYYAPPVGPR